MQIFIDESGNFTDKADISVVCALTAPHKNINKLRSQISELANRDQWLTTHQKEFKGGYFKKEHLKDLITILFNNSVLLNCVATTVREEDNEEISVHQEKQCIKLTKNLTSDHQPSFKEDVFRLRTELEKMPPQLYIQCTLMRELVWSTLQKATMYFSQRRPYELGKFSWYIDAKDQQKITSQEQWWKTTLCPLLERCSLALFEKGNYNHFNKNYSFSKDMWFPDNSRKMMKGHHLNKIFTEELYFIDSKKELLIQVTDILTSFIRKALKQEIKDIEILRCLGKLFIPQMNTQGMLSLYRNKLIDYKIVNILLEMASTGREMLRIKLRKKDMEGFSRLNTSL